jgi:hypothetical protein
METYDKDITAWIPNYSFTEPNITIPRTDFPELSEAEADDESGDFANLLYAFLHEIYAVWATIPNAGRPQKMFISKSISPDVVTGDETVQFSIRFTTAVDAGARNVKPEPVEE